MKKKCVKCGGETDTTETYYRQGRCPACNEEVGKDRMSDGQVLPPNIVRYLRKKRYFKNRAEMFQFVGAQTDESWNKWMDAADAAPLERY